MHDGWAEVSGAGLQATEGGREGAAELEDRANEAMREYVLERPHTATVYGLVAAMQSGRFTVAGPARLPRRGAGRRGEEDAG